MLATAISPDDARRHAEETVKRSKTSFGPGMRILSKPRREGMYAVYAFCREVDDIADEGGTREEKLAALNEWRAEIDRLYDGAPQTPTGVALLVPVRQFDIPKEEFILMIEGMEMDAKGPIIAPSLDYMDRAFTDAKQYGWSRKPIVEMLIPSTVDDSLAPPGQHVASLFCQQFAPELPDGKSWSDYREEAADHVIETVNNYAPNFKKSVLGRMVLTPQDLEDKFGLMGGDIFHGAMTLDQMWAARPALGVGDYRGAVKRLYHCGSGAHPGGGVMGAPGQLAAREILTGGAC